MLFPRINKILLLSISNESPHWQALFYPDQVSQNDIYRIIGISKGTASNWRHGRRIDPEKILDIFVRLPINLRNKDRTERSKLPFNSLDTEHMTARNRLATALENIYSAINNYDIHFYEIAKFLDLPITSAQKIIDSVIYIRYPVFSTIFYGQDDRSQENAKLDFDEYRGVYEVYCQRGEHWLKASLRVRYLLEIGDGVAIRCKMNFPMIKPIEGRGRRTVYEYDGFLALRDQHIFWMFEKRQMDRGDYFHFITRTGRVFNGDFSLFGTYLTTGQDTRRSIEMGELMMRRVEADDVDTMEAFMHAPLSIAENQSECQLLAERLSRIKHEEE